MGKRLVILALVSAASAFAAHASVPLGVYAIVDTVVLEPSETHPERLQVWGSFALWDEAAASGYREPSKGYLYYVCSKQHAATCRNEWADLKSMAGSGEIVGFGSRSLGAGRVRSHGDTVSAPDPYPVQFGVVRMGSSPRGAVFAQLKRLAGSR